MAPESIVLVLVALLGPTAMAGGPEITVERDHQVKGEVTVAAHPDDVREVLADPVKLAVIDGNTAKIRLLSEDSCKTIHTAIQHPVASVNYTARVCPTALGWRTELVDSDDLRDFHSEWSMEPVEGGVRLRYIVRTIPRIAVPQWLVDRQTRGSVKRMLTRVKDHLEGR